MPKLALIGRPNVGKSSLFNKLTRSKAALVAETPGLTRDRRYAKATFPQGEVTIIDTGGIAQGLEDPLAQDVVNQTNQAISEADALLLIFDGSEGLTPDDLDLLGLVRRSKKPFVAAVNKIDSDQRLANLAEFYETGLDQIVDISVKTGRGLNKLKDVLSKLLFKEPRAEVTAPCEDEGDKASLTEDEAGEDELTPIRVSIIGRPNVGKSSILNRILGEPRMVVSDLPGTTRDAIDCLVERPGHRPIIFVDTAGVRRKSRVKDKIEKFSAIKSLDSIKDSDICICVFDASEGITDQDKRLVGYTSRFGKGCITLYNKWDLVKSDPTRVRILNEEAKFLKKLVPYAPHLNVSARTGKNLDKLFPLIDDVFHDYNYKETTGKLNRILRQAIARRNPPVTKGHYLKLYYVTQTDTKPPTFTFFANYPELFPDHYKRYLSNFFRKELNIPHTPIKIVLRAR
ncbi:MAG: ribosome biogenesis GTPase Der [Thermodesulfobacteria bacterium]|nr:ribosome biogenesis GTPase Der [Thermodesulfobacteriota bacterium]